jgi:hypothetical protein
MKTHTFIIALFTLAIVFAPPFSKIANADTGTYAARLISPTAGQVLVPGKQVKVTWTAAFPFEDLSWCEMEIWLSLDGGKSFPYQITAQLDPRISFFYWTVPNTPSNAAVLDIRFGCEGFYPESYSPQPGSTFAIAASTATLY